MQTLDLLYEDKKKFFILIYLSIPYKYKNFKIYLMIHLIVLIIY